MKKLMLLVFSISLAISAEKVIVNNSVPNVSLVSSSETKTVLEFSGGDFTKSSVTIEGKEYFYLDFQGEPTLLERGNPKLPKMVRSIIIPDHAKMEINILDSDFIEFDLSIAPSKGSITRNIDPKTVPYTFSEIYETNEFYPKTLVNLGLPYIMRNFRGMTVTAYPFRYNPVTNILRVYTYIKVEIIENGVSTENVKVSRSASVNQHFSSLYSEHFINYDRTRYETVEERGRMIVIAYGDFMNAVQPYVDWKNQKGIRTDLYDVNEMGSNSTGIKNFIQDQYDMNDGLCFVQLVGDHAQIPTIMVSNGGGGGSDPSFALLEGNDYYPEIFVGRFSASTLAHVQTQVERTIHYERDIDSGSWLHKGCGIASNQGPGDDGEYDQQHSANIRDKLLDYTYTEVDGIYDPSGTDQQGINAINAGRGIINYTGHGSETAWGNGASLNNNQINNLTNDLMLPHVISVGCVNGAFENTTCFGETWLRATNGSNGNPTGAIAFYASTVNQYWDEPMRAQDHAMDLLVGYNYSNNQVLDKKYSIGGLWYNGSCNMMDVYGQSGIDMFLTWIIFGDVSLDVRSDTPSSISVEHSGILTSEDAAYEVITNAPDLLVALSYEGILFGSGYTDDNGVAVVLISNPLDLEAELVLTVSGYNKITQIETVTYSTGPSEVQINVDYLDDWNLVGLPVLMEDSNYSNLFPNAIENTLYSFGTTGYSHEVNLEAGTGYVLRLTANETVAFEGLTLDNLSIPLTNGWNLISGISSQVSVDYILDPGNIIIPNTIYGYSENGYSNAVTIDPGYGYWLRTNEPGEIQLSSSNRAKTRMTFENKLNNAHRFTINGKSLFFGMSIPADEADQYSLPPKPPVGAKDIRFSNDTKLCTTNDCVIEIMDNGLTTTFEFEIKNGENWKIIPVISNQVQPDEAILMNGQNQITLHSNVEQLILRKSTLSQTPIEFALFPAYPNPFNPETTISFGLPVDSEVKISVYNLMGQKVSTLISGNFNAGIHSVTWNGISDDGYHVSAGVYLYTIETDEFREMRKMILMK